MLRLIVVFIVILLTTGCEKPLEDQTPQGDGNLMATTAKKSSWKNEEFGETVKLAFACKYSEAEFRLIEKGLIPQEMEDKWFIYFDEPFLYLHRSWTGLPVYKLKIVKTNDLYSVQEAHYSKSLVNKDTNLVYESELLDFLVSNFLLGNHKPFPKPINIQEQMPGAYQHGISGTGYKEKIFKPQNDN